MHHDGRRIIEVFEEPFTLLEGMFIFLVFGNVRTEARYGVDLALFICQRELSHEKNLLSIIILNSDLSLNGKPGFYYFTMNFIQDFSTLSGNNLAGFVSNDFMQFLTVKLYKQLVSVDISAFGVFDNNVDEGIFHYTLK